MKNKQEIETELKAAFDDRDVKGEDGTVLSEARCFPDYVTIGTWLSSGLRTSIKGDPVIRTALLSLEDEMVSRIKKYYSKDTRAVTYFKTIQEHYQKKEQPRPEKDTDFSKLLTASLGQFEREHGFLVAGDRLPNYAGFVYGNVFKESLTLKQHWKDVGAGDTHGEYSHRLQWYIVIKAGAIVSSPRNQEALVFQSMANFQRGKTNLWTYLFDQLKNSPSIGGDKEDFRSPENLNLWLVGDQDPEFCPVLRAFLRARMAKRATDYRLDEYLQRKLKISREAIDAIMAEMVQDNMQKKNPSARILFPAGAKPKLSKWVGQ